MTDKEELELNPLKDYIEFFYKDEICQRLSIALDDIEYKSSDEIYIINTQPKKDFKKLPDSKQILKSAEERLNHYLSNFNCSKNKDVEYFLKSKSIQFNKDNIARTFLITNPENDIVGYFSLASKTLFVNEKLPAKKKKLANAKKMKIDDTMIVNAFLIGQIGRDDRFTSDDLNLDIFFKYIFEKINIAKSIIGGSVILIEVDNEEKLINKYKEYDFKYLQNDGDLSQLWYLSLDY